MAKKSNTIDVTAGLTYGASRTVAEEPAVKQDTTNTENQQNALNTELNKVTETAPVQETPVVEEKPAVTASEVKREVVPEVQPQQTPENSPVNSVSDILVGMYEAKRQAEAEPRTVRIQAVVTPTVGRLLDEYTQLRKIKSRNDLINSLLEGYFGLDNSGK